MKVCIWVIQHYIGNSDKPTTCLHNKKSALFISVHPLLSYFLDTDCSLISLLQFFFLFRKDCKKKVGVQPHTVSGICALTFAHSQNLQQAVHKWLQGTKDCPLKASIYCMCVYETTCVPPTPGWLVFGHRCVLCCPQHTEDAGSLQEREAHEKPLYFPLPTTFNTTNIIKICHYYVNAKCRGNVDKYLCYLYLGTIPYSFCCSSLLHKHRKRSSQPDPLSLSWDFTCQQSISGYVINVAN